MSWRLGRGHRERVGVHSTTSGDLATAGLLYTLYSGDLATAVRTIAETVYRCYPRDRSARDGLTNVFILYDFYSILYFVLLRCY